VTWKFTFLSALSLWVELTLHVFTGSRYILINGKIWAAIKGECIIYQRKPVFAPSDLCARNK
jgi:hypothetical protein